MTINVCGLGPSIKEYDGSGISIGVNDVWRHVPTTYLLVVNNLSRWPDRHKYVVESKPEILWSQIGTYASHPAYRFIGSWQRWSVGTVPKPGTQYSSNNSTFMAAARAKKMGATEIILWGVDFENHKDINGKILERAVSDFVTFAEAVKKQGCTIRLGTQYGALKGLL